MLLFVPFITDSYISKIVMKCSRYGVLNVLEQKIAEKHYTIRNDGGEVRLLS